MVRLAWTNPTQNLLPRDHDPIQDDGLPDRPSRRIDLLCDRATVPGASRALPTQEQPTASRTTTAAFAHDSDNHSSNAAHAAATPVRTTCSYVKTPARRLAGRHQRQGSERRFHYDRRLHLRAGVGRSSGLRMATIQTGLAPGDRVNVSGRMSTRVLSGHAAERVMDGHHRQRSLRPCNALSIRSQ